jgi:hypothetical protein
MRLTLRTMLAFLDDILKPADAEDLRRKIDDSEFAKGLVHRIRASTHRGRLGAPTLDGKGMGLDPNTVAEYLDNVLPPERVPELEKICLESDVHLAEAASCHQILALVLGEAASVPPELRDRCYRIGSPDTTRVAARADTSDSVEPLDGSGTLAAPPVATGDAHAATLEEPAPPPGPGDVPAAMPLTTRKRTVVPDYLRAGKGTPWKPMLITLAIVFALVVTFLLALGPLDHTHPIAKLLGLRAEPELVAEGTSASPIDTDGPETGAATGAASGGSGEGESDDNPSDSGSSPPAEFVEDVPPAGSPAAEADGDSASEQAAEGGAEGMTEGSGNDVPAEPGTPEFPPTEAMPATDAGTGAEAQPSEAEATEPAADDPEAPPATPAPPVDVGFVKDLGQHFLLRRDRASGNWFRLPGRAKLSSGDDLAVLPTYRPEIVLQPGVQVVCVGPTRARPLPPGDQGEPGLALLHGRAFASTAGVAGARLRLDLAGYQATVTLTEPDSEIAVDVARYLPAGGDPIGDGTTRVVHVFATVGDVQWQDQDGSMATIRAGQVRIVAGDRSETLTASGYPPWMVREELEPIELLASRDLEPTVTTDRPAILALNEQAEDRKSEIRSLAARSLAFLGSFEALVAEFKNEQQRAFWAIEFDALRDGLTYGRTSATNVRATLETYHGDKAQELYQMLCGYDPQQLVQGADGQLVDWLSDGALIARVLAYENLRRITGKTHYYQPWATEARRKSSVQDWLKELNEGGIRYATPPGPVTYGQ